MRSVAALVCLGWMGFAQADATAGKVTSDLCKVDTELGDRREISCAIPRVGSARQYRFVVRFSGGHDDTRAWMTLKLNEQALACEPGSKIELEGEEGDVSLECTFTVPAHLDGGHRLGVYVQWHHAQYTDFSFEEALNRRAARSTGTEASAPGG